MTVAPRIRATVLLLATALLAGCSSAASSSTSPSSAGTSSSPSPSSSSSSASPSPSGSPPSPSAASSSPAAAAVATAPVASASCPKRYTSAALAACIASATRVYVATWQRDLAASGFRGTLTPPKVVVFAAIPKNPCISNEGDAAEASFFCSKNNTLYFSGTAAKSWTVDYARAAAARHVLASDARTAGTTAADLRTGYPLVGATTEFAHEFGHWAQKVTGQLAWYEARTASSNFTVSGKAEATGEGAADCMAGWLQGRTAVDRTWVDTRIGHWAHFATMAELGFDFTTVKANFTFPKENPASITGYGNSYTRLLFYKLGEAAGRAKKHGLAYCSHVVATYVKAPLPPHS
jgi:predicted metalloprotease